MRKTQILLAIAALAGYGVAFATQANPDGLANGLGVTAFCLCGGLFMFRGIDKRI